MSTSCTKPISTKPAPCHQPPTYLLELSLETLFWEKNKRKTKLCFGGYLHSWCLYINSINSDFPIYITMIRWSLLGSHPRQQSFGCPSLGLQGEFASICTLSKRSAVSPLTSSGQSCTASHVSCQESAEGAWKAHRRAQVTLWVPLLHWWQSSADSAQHLSGTEMLWRERWYTRTGPC